MGAKQCGPHEHVIPPQPPAEVPHTFDQRTSVVPLPIVTKVEELVRFADRLQKSGPSEYYTPAFRRLLAMLDDLKRHIQPELKGMAEHFKAAEPESAAKKRKATLPEIIAFVTGDEIQLPESDAKAFFYHMESQGWRVNRESVKDWKMTVRKWKEYGYMASQKLAQGNRRNGAPEPKNHVSQEIARDLARVRKGLL